MRNVIIFSSIDWDDNWQVHQELALYLKKNGYRVLFVENSGARSIYKINDLYRIIKRVKNLYNSSGGFRPLINGVLLLTPLIFPFPNSKFFLKINEFLLLTKIKKWLSYFSYENTIIISFLPTPLNFNLVKKIRPLLKIFYYADSMSQSSIYTKYLEYWEDKTIVESDMIFTSSNSLFQKVKKLNSSVHYYRAGLADIFYRNYNKKKLKKYFIGYVGSVSEVVDLLLIKKIAKKYPNKLILIVGPIYNNIKILENIKNINFVSQKKFPDILDYYRDIEIGIIPYKKNYFTKTVFPTKLNEYLISGCSVISTDINEVSKFNQKFKNLIHVAKSHNEFLKLIQKITIQNKFSIKFPPKANLKKYLQSCSWENNFNSMKKNIDRKLLEKNFSRPDGIEILKNQFTLSTKIFFKLSFFLLLLFIIINNNSVIKYIAAPLQKFEIQSKNADSLFLLSGSSADFEERDIEARSKEAIQLYKNTKIKNIILYDANFKNEIILNTIIYSFELNGIPKDKIKILKQTESPSNTYVTAKLIKEFKKKNNIENSLLLTHPYNSLRLSLTLKKQNTNVAIFDNSKSINYKPTLDQKFYLIRIIIHEYLALLHNYIINRI